MCVWACVHMSVCMDECICACKGVCVCDGIIVILEGLLTSWWITKSWSSISEKLGILAPILLWQIRLALKCAIPGEMHFLSLSLDKGYSDHSLARSPLQDQPQPKSTPGSCCGRAGRGWVTRRWGLPSSCNGVPLGVGEAVRGQLAHYFPGIWSLFSFLSLEQNS